MNQHGAWPEKQILSKISKTCFTELPVTLKPVENMYIKFDMISEANQGGDLSREPRVRLEFPEAVCVISYGPLYDLSVSFSHICINATSLYHSHSPDILLSLSQSKILLFFIYPVCEQFF